MQFDLLHVAALLTVLLGIAHSVIGEIVIFRRLFNRSGEQAVVVRGLPVRHLRILRVSWHLVSVFGFGLASLIMSYASTGGSMALESRFIPISVATFAFAGILTLVGTKGKHPAWAVLFAISILIYLSA